MFKYKREINNYNDAKQIEYSLTDNEKVCFCTNGILGTKKPYQGMYIKDGKVLLETIVETFSNGKATYRVGEFETSSGATDTKDKIIYADLENNEFRYNFNNINFTKRFAFNSEYNVLCIEYSIDNLTGEDIVFSSTPLLTYRDYYNMKNCSMLKFNERDTDDGIFVSLSVLNQENIVLKSDKMRWISEDNGILNVKHEKITTANRREIYYEDLKICGKFSSQIKSGQKTKLYVFVSYKDFNIDKINVDETFENIAKRNKNAIFTVNENFVELQDMAKAINNLYMGDNIISCIPYEKRYNVRYINTIKDLTDEELSKDLTSLIEIVRAVEGEYLCFSKVKEAKNTVFTIYKIIKEVGKRELNDELKEKYNLLRLWYIESVNRILQKEGRIELYIDSIKEILYNLIEPENRATCFNTIELTALMLNAVKIYLNILSIIGMQDKQIELQEIYFTNLIKNEYWIKEKGIMKRRIDENVSYANIEMIYTLSLSFPCVNGDIPNKILDTAFKELYTPYGLRKISKFSSQYDDTIYPRYIAHFIKANLRLTGVTRAAQKISYNLVKELIQDTSKYVNGGTKKIYSERGTALDSNAYDLLTNAEMIRLYNMFI